VDKSVDGLVPCYATFFGGFCSFHSRSQKCREVSMLDVHLQKIVCVYDVVLEQSLKYVYICMHVYKEPFCEHCIAHYSHLHQVNIMGGSSL